MKKSLSYCLLMFLGSAYLSGSVNADDNCVPATLEYKNENVKPSTSGDPEMIGKWVQIRIGPGWSCGSNYIHDIGQHQIQVPKRGFTIIQGNANGSNAEDTKTLLTVGQNEIKDNMKIVCDIPKCDKGGQSCPDTHCSVGQ